MSKWAIKKTLVRLTIFSVLAAVGVVAVPSRAMAHNICTSGDVCYYWGSYLSGSSVGVHNEDNDLCNPWIGFQSSGTGQYQTMCNNAGSIKNLSETGMGVWYGANYTGACDVMWTYGSALLDDFTTQNDNRSQTWYEGQVC